MTRARARCSLTLVAFTGTPVLEQVSDRTCRVSGVQLALATSGTIGLAGATGGAPDITLPSNLGAADYSYQGSDVPLTSSIQVLVNPVSSAGNTNLQVSVSKAGTTVGTWRVTITNTNVGLATQTLEIYLTFLGGGRVTQPSRVAP